MAEIQRQDLTEVESLLASRQQLNAWLEKLEAAGSKTPASVRERVRTDYQGRLAQVVEQLRGHSDVISSSLAGLRSQAAEFGALRADEQETLAEAELRYSVGEYADDEWHRVERDCSGKIRGLDDEIGRLNGEIGRLEEVLAQIAPPAPPRRREPEPPPVVRAPDPPPPVVAKEAPPLIEHEPEPAAPPEPVEAPRFVPRGGLKSRESGPVRAVQFPGSNQGRESAPAAPAVDELTFLKSMTLETKAPERPNQTVAKTLKCGECGALNRPTEWYCDRCGAELAAV